MSAKLMAAVLAFSSIVAGCGVTGNRDFDADRQAVMDVQNGCSNMTGGMLETCRRAGAGGLSGWGSDGSN